jgi:cation diffusion facilitator family transporter
MHVAGRTAGGAGRAAADDRILQRYAVVSIAAAVTTIACKALAVVLTGSVGLLSDAIESGVNLVAALVALLALVVATRPPDREHEFGHGNAEYLSAGFEGAMVLLASGTIVWTAIQRLVDPQQIERAGIGLALTVVASAVNLAVGATLIRAGRRHRSLTLVADGEHLLTDVWTSVGVVAGVTLVAIFHWVALDPIVALLVGVNILRVGLRLVRRSLVGLLDAALPDEDVAAIDAVLDRHRERHGVEFAPGTGPSSGRTRSPRSSGATSSRRSRPA